MQEGALREILARCGRLVRPIEWLGKDDDLHEAGLTTDAEADVARAIEQAGVAFPAALRTARSFGSIAVLLDTVSWLERSRSDSRAAG